MSGFPIRSSGSFLLFLSVGLMSSVAQPLAWTMELENDPGSRPVRAEVRPGVTKIYAPNTPIAPFVRAGNPYPGSFGGGPGGGGPGQTQIQQMGQLQGQGQQPPTQAAFVKHHRVWVVSANIYAQLLPAATGSGKSAEWGCFTDQEQPSSKTYHLVKSSESRQIDLDEEGPDGTDPKVSSKLKPGERFNNRDLRKKYQSSEVPLSVSPDDCRRLNSGH